MLRSSFMYAIPLYYDCSSAEIVEIREPRFAEPFVSYNGFDCADGSVRPA